MTWVVLQGIDPVVQDLIEFIPELVGALVVLVVGVIVGGVLETRVALLVSKTDIGETVMETPVGRAARNAGQVDTAVGAAVKYYVYLLALLIAAGLLGLSRFAAWVDAAVSYVPALLGAVAVLVIGLLAADWATGVVADSEAVGDAPLAVAAVRSVLYFLVAVIALDTAGADVGVIEAAVGSTVVALLIAIALIVGLALGRDRTEDLPEPVGDLLGADGEGDSE